MVRIGSETFHVIAIVLVIIIAIAIIILGICIPLITQDEVTLTVTKTDSYTTTSCDSDSDGHVSCSTYLHNLVYTNGEILQFNNCIVLWIWDSQTRYSHIESGVTYKFKVYGFNVPWLNWYRSVISYKEYNVGSIFSPTLDEALTIMER
jgi:hypothetical protein